MASDPTNDEFKGPGGRDYSSRPGTSAEYAELADKAERCRRLAAGISDRQAAEVLRKMAVSYERACQGVPNADQQQG